MQPITLLVAVFASSGNGFSFLAASMSMRARSLGSLVELKRLCSWATPAGTALDEESDCSAAQRSTGSDEVQLSCAGWCWCWCAPLLQLLSGPTFCMRLQTGPRPCAGPRTYLLQLRRVACYARRCARCRAEPAARYQHRCWCNARRAGGHRGGCTPAALQAGARRPHVGLCEKLWLHRRGAHRATVATRCGVTEDPGHSSSLKHSSAALHAVYQSFKQGSCQTGPTTKS